MTGDADEVLGQGVLRAATRAMNLCLAGVLATSSVILHSWPMFGASLAGYATLVAWDLTRLGFWKRVLHELRTRPPPLPDPESFTDTVARHFICRMQQARIELRRVLQQNRRALPPRMVGQIELVPAIETRALSFIARLEELARYLADKNVRGLRNEVERLRRAAENSANPRLGAEFRNAYQAVADELATLEQLAAARDLLVAKLETVASTLETFPCAVVRLQVMEAEAREEEPAFDARALLTDGATVEELLKEERC